MGKRFVVFLGAVTIIVACRQFRAFLGDATADGLALVFPGAVTFGAYTSYLVLALAFTLAHASRRGHGRIRALLSRHGLLFLLVLGLCADLVLINYTEALPASRRNWYGMVILIDLATWVLLTLVMFANQPGRDAAFQDSLAVSAIPWFFLCREYTFMSDPWGSGKAGLDFRVLAAIAIAWLFTPTGLAKGSLQRFARVGRWGLRWVLLSGLVYWIVLVVTNLLSRLKLVGIGETDSLKLGFLITGAVLALALMLYKPFRDRFAEPCECTLARA